MRIKVIKIISAGLALNFLQNHFAKLEVREKRRQFCERQLAFNKGDEGVHKQVRQAVAPRVAKYLFEYLQQFARHHVGIHAVHSFQRIEAHRIVGVGRVNEDDVFFQEIQVVRVLKKQITL